MAGTDKHSRTEKPTGKRISKAKREGTLPRSREMSSTFTLLAAIVTLYATGSTMVATLKRTSQELLGGLGNYPVTDAGVYSLLLKIFGSLGVILGPFLVILTAVVFFINVAQEPFSISWERIKFDLAKLNPVTGFQRFFNRDAFIEVFKSSIKLAIVGYIAYRILRDEVDSLAYLADSDIQGIFEFVSRISLKIVLHTCGVMLILSVIDLFYVKWRFLDNLKMTKQQVKDESREMEGDPKIKGKIRSLQMAAARRRMKKIIPTADVVVTNPTHFAVALKYDREKMGAPTVLAKGVDFMAQRIKEIARESGVMMVENRPLARELYATVEEGQEIPESLYAAVAEILAYVYGIKGKA
jgi:flagellar biosynthetic protein FlhB